jgi:biopolymer transport protein ExbD
MRGSAVKTQMVPLHAGNPEGAVVIQADQASRSALLIQVIDPLRIAGINPLSIAATVAHD